MVNIIEFGEQSIPDKCKFGKDRFVTVLENPNTPLSIEKCTKRVARMIDSDGIVHLNFSTVSKPNQIQALAAKIECNCYRYLETLNRWLIRPL